MSISSQMLKIPLKIPPRVHSISLFHVPEPHSFDCRSTKRWGMDIWDSQGHIDFVDRGISADVYPGQMFITPPGSHVLGDFPAGRRSWFAAFETDAPTDADETIAVRLELHEHGTAVAEAMRRAEQYWAVQPSRATQLFWGVLLDLADLSRRPASPARHPVIAEAREWIEQHLSEPFSVTQLAAAIHVGRTVLARLFRRHVGQTVVEYLRALRVRRAEAMLTQTNLPIKEIAIRVGLGDPQHFNKTVRRQRGVSPSEIRRRHGE
ncbi:MAG: helix-turn-helix domain-containing protein [Phycisphaerae bacterium]|nr:helix-turn-helix domain-containing protein [Phycisphaerae bacterium]